MDLKDLIQKIKKELEAVEKHKADYCSLETEHVKSIVEYLEQLDVIIEN